MRRISSKVKWNDRTVPSLCLPSVLQREKEREREREREREPGWQKNASRREARGAHNRSGDGAAGGEVYPDPSNYQDRLLCFVPTTGRQ